MRAWKKEGVITPLSLGGKSKIYQEQFLSKTEYGNIYWKVIGQQSSVFHLPQKL